jgi:uncharacterized integral membrane protein
MKNARMIALSVLAVLVAVVVLQNTEAVETKILFMTVTMPRAVLLFVTAALGFAAGVLTAMVWLRSQARADRG